MSELLRILLVEDNPGDADLIQEQLSQDGTKAFAIDCVPRLATAVELVRTNRFHIILLDLTLPDSAGLDTLRVMRQQAAGTPIVVLTGNDDERVGLAAIQEGAQDYVVKGPATGPLLSRILRYALERAKMEEQILQSQKMEAVGRLAGGVAHDFNNMLTVIIGRAEIALSKLDATNPICAHIQAIKKAGQRSADLTRQLLTFARKQPIAPKVLNLNDTVGSMLKMIGRLIGENIELIWKPAANLWLVKMDPGQIGQILVNLAANARDAITGTGKITIATGQVELDKIYCDAHPDCVPGKYVLLTVSDTGCGMDKKTLERLFEPFFTTKGIGKGAGLGLATLYGIVKQNQGLIEVYSEPGQGTTFKVYLLRHEAQDVSIDKTPLNTKAPIGTETVLLVEDDAEVLELFQSMLERLGYTVLSAGGSQQALHIASNYAGDIPLLVADVIMPGMSGRDLWQRLDTLRPGIKSLFMSGHPARVIAPYGVLEEGMHFLQKPFSLEALAMKLREVLAGK